MKKTALTLSLLIYLTLGLLAQSKIINNPSFEFKISGIYNVTKVELCDTATFVYIHNTFIPRWWVQFNDNEVIRDSDTGQEYLVKGIIGAEMGKYLWMPDSGDSTIVLVFPPLPPSVKKIDYQKQIFGISLDESKSGKQKEYVVSPAIDNWMKSELAKAPSSSLSDFKSPDFFKESPARLIGCIKGYDPRAGFTTGIIYAENIITNDDFPLVVKIEADGRFYADIPMNMPQNSYVVFGDRYLFRFYIEPGQTLAMVLNWDEFLIADRKRNIRYDFSQIEYHGQLAQVNHELMDFPDVSLDYKEFDIKRKSLAPMDFKADQEKQLLKNLAHLEDYKNNNPISTKTQSILHSKIVLGIGMHLFDYTMQREYYAQQDSTNAILKMPIPNEYYSFLKQIDLNDQSLLVSDEFSVFINRFEYCDLFYKVINEARKNISVSSIKPDKSLHEYFIDEKVELTDNEQKYLSLAGKSSLSEEDKSELKLMEETSKAFSEKYKDQIQKYADKYITPLYSKTYSELDSWRIKDSILVNVMGLKPSLTYEIAKLRSLGHSFKFIGKKELANELWSNLQQGIKNPYLLSIGNTLLNDAFPENQVTAFPLPEGEATEIFRKIIEPFKGKVLFVDFWATTCGPCISGIKSMKATREKYAENADFEFVFITDEGGSPEKSYNDFVKEQDLKNIFRLTKDEFNYLRQLFKFNGIPRYVVISSNGDVLSENFSMYNFEYELPKMLTANKK